MKCNASSHLGRRAFLQLSGLAALGTCLDPLANAAVLVPPVGAPKPAPTHVLHIRRAQVELAPGRLITTTTYDGQLPGPLLRTTVGERVIVDVCNETDLSERISWQGQVMAEDEACLVPAHSVRRMEFAPTRPGLHLYHSDLIAAGNLNAALYSGQAGALLVEPRSLPGRHDREWVVVVKSCEPFARRSRRGYEVAYSSVTINGRLPGHSPELRANIGERVLVHVLNASATESHVLELAGHAFELPDGSAAAGATQVAALHLHPGESVSAFVTLNRPAQWILRQSSDATEDGARPRRLSYCEMLREPESTLQMVLTRQDAARSGFSRWRINDASFSASDPRASFRVRPGLRYRLKIHNTSDEIIPVRLRRHQLQIAAIAGVPTQGRVADVVAIPAQQHIEVDFTADGQGPALFHCTRQLHKDFGLMALIDQLPINGPDPASPTRIRRRPS